MVSLSKKVDYALISLAHMIASGDQVASARQIALLHGLPVPVMMEILKRLHRQGILTSTRGVKGGYQIAVNLDDLSLARLIEIVEDPACKPGRARQRLSSYPPIQGLQFRLMQFLDQLAVTDLVKPGRRIDVPLEWVRVSRRNAMASIPA